MPTTGHAPHQQIMLPTDSFVHAPTTSKNNETPETIFTKFST